MRYVLIAVPLLLFSVERAASQLPPLPERTAGLSCAAPKPSCAEADNKIPQSEHRSNVCFGSWSFSNSGRGVKLSVHILAGSIVLSAVGACPPHNGVR